ncbi:hypothetical protein C2E20_7912 [Micractinium conductrix]|uniref:Uncharacterized protein n=1 Tax=Micractinium conductrix TaxID=554055 RepID=A0A2P6V397_9CHLO|nr:hypothetical protein C2E20_7912 [Micractinium conductrix]|eukprot:PSC68555.1 hypothetical protein C2E20_7912 [Micractinium conductrix]
MSPRTRPGAEALAPQAGRPVPVQLATAPAPPRQQHDLHIGRRTTLLSFSGLAFAPGALLDSLRGEADLWKQEAQLYGRQAASALSEATGPQQAALEASSREAAAAAAALPLDAALAAVLLEAPLQALCQRGGGGAAAAAASSARQQPPPLPPFDEARYQRDFQALLKQELPYFKSAGSCGHCGADAGPGALSDRAWFDFLSYIQYKALAKQIGGAVAASTALTGLERMHAASPEMQLRAAEQAWQDSLGQQPAALSGVGSIGGGGAFGGTREEQQRAAAAAYRSRAGQAARESGTVAPPPLTPADALRLAKGASILRHAEADLAEASSRGEAGTAAALAAIRSTSPELDAVRAGGQALLAWFAAKGYIASASSQQFGLSLDEYENHYVWSLGEPAFLKYWLQAPATLRSSAALDQEQGFSQDYVASTLQAWFRRCGVVAGTLKRYPSYSQPDLIAEQWTLRRVAPLPEGHDWQRYRDPPPPSRPPPPSCTWGVANAQTLQTGTYAASSAVCTGAAVSLALDSPFTSFTGSCPPRQVPFADTNRGDGVATGLSNYCDVNNFPGGYALKASGSDVAITGFGLIIWLTNGQFPKTVRFTGAGGSPVVDVDLTAQRWWSYNMFNRTAYTLPTPFRVPANAAGYTFQVLGEPNGITSQQVSSVINFSDFTAELIPSPPSPPHPPPSPPAPPSPPPSPSPPPPSPPSPPPPPSCTWDLSTAQYLNPGGLASSAGCTGPAVTLTLDSPFTSFTGASCTSNFAGNAFYAGEGLATGFSNYCNAFNFPGGYSLKPSGAVLVRGFAIKNWITNGGAVQTVRFTGPGGLPVVDVDIPEPQRTWNFNSWNRTAYALPTPFLVPANAVGYTMQALGAPGAFTDPPVSAFVVFSDITAFVVE